MMSTMTCAAPPICSSRMAIAAEESAFVRICSASRYSLNVDAVSASGIGRSHSSGDTSARRES